MGMSDAQFKDVLRRDLDVFEDLKEILESKETQPDEKLEEIQKKIGKQIDRINKSLQD